MSMELADQREFPRMSTRAGARFRVVEAPDPSLVSEANVADLSCRGLLIETSRSLHCFDILKLELQLPGVSSVHAYAHVAWSRQVGEAWRAGLRFFGISEMDEDRLSEMVASSMKKRPRKDV